jgi:multidrug efflux pump subunit AcrA (membrane-fusion protein)
MIRMIAWTACALCVLGAIGLAWKYAQQQPAAAPESAPAAHAAAELSAPVKLSEQARANLKLTTQPLKPTTYWRTVEFPGVIVDRPGVTHRGVVAPVAGVVSEIHASPGDAVEPGAPLFTLRLVSDSLYSSQLELFKATKEVELARKQLARLSEAAESGALPESRTIEIENQIERLSATVLAYQQDLRGRGLPEDQIEAAAAGKFLREIVVRAPAEHRPPTAEAAAESPGSGPTPPVTPVFELESLRAELGQQVAAGDVLGNLADHQLLLIEGRGFRDDMPWVQQAAKNGWEVETAFPAAGGASEWPAPPAKLPIDHISNSIDPETRTFSIYLPLQNRWHEYQRDGKPRLLWQFRPGSQLRMRIPVERFDGVFVLPQDAVVWEGPEAYVFRQNGESFERRPVQVLHQDRLNVVIAANKSIRANSYIAQNAAASLNRIMKAQSASGMPAGMHVHADGTVHGSH